MNAKRILIVLVLAGMLFTAVGRASAESCLCDPVWAATQPQSLTGMWTIKVIPDEGSGLPQIVTLSSVMPNGKIIGLELYKAVSLGGKWSETGYRRFAIALQGSYPVNGDSFDLKIRSTVSLSDSGEEFSGRFTADVYDATGHLILTLNGTATALRRHVER